LGPLVLSLWKSLTEIHFSWHRLFWQPWPIPCEGCFGRL
jgi:hypothetical protein